MSKPRVIAVSGGHRIGKPIEQEIDDAIADMEAWAKSIGGEVKTTLTVNGEGIEHFTIVDKNGKVVKTFATC